MELVYVPIDRYQVVRINLLERASFFSFYMKKHRYFYYLEELHKIHNFGEKGIV
jgi:hypothetical protein